MPANTNAATKYMTLTSPDREKKACQYGSEQMEKSPNEEVGGCFCLFYELPGRQRGSLGANSSSAIVVVQKYVELVQ